MAFSWIYIDWENRTTCTSSCFRSNFIHLSDRYDCLNTPRLDDICFHTVLWRCHFINSFRLTSGLWLGLLLRVYRFTLCLSLLHLLLNKAHLCHKYLNKEILLSFFTFRLKMFNIYHCWELSPTWSSCFWVWPLDEFGGTSTPEN